MKHKSSAGSSHLLVYFKHKHVRCSVHQVSAHASCNNMHARCSVEAESRTTSPQVPPESRLAVAARVQGRNCIGALFSSKIFYKIDTVALSFVFDKYCPIMD